MPDSAAIQSRPVHKATVERMICVLREENAALACMDFAKAGDLLSVKFGIADTLASIWRSDQQATLSVAMKRELSDLVEQNRRLIKAMMAAHTGALDQLDRVIKATPDRRMTMLRSQSA